MADIDLTQVEADALIAMEKHCIDDKEWQFPGPGENLTVPLTSHDKRENFLLDVTRGQVKLTKVTYQNRARQTVVLIRLDLGGPPHRNPDDVEISCPHLHVYREGYGDKWAVPAPVELCSSIDNLVATLEAFMQYCNITEAPRLNRGLF
jgi:hypothetical protein